MCDSLGLVSERDKSRRFIPRTSVAPHLGGESFGIVLLEAMASSTPVLASNLEAFRLVLRTAETGRSSDRGRECPLASSIVEMLGNEPLRNGVGGSRPPAGRRVRLGEGLPRCRAGLRVGGDARASCRQT